MNGEPVIDSTVDLDEVRGWAVVTVSGTLDALSLPEVRVCVDEAIGRSRPLVLDMSGVTFIGPAGVTLLLDTAARTEDLRVVASRRVLHVLDAVDARAAVALHSSVTAATVPGRLRRPPEPRTG
ncbi:STAS domain-containing protein [Umezawaea sp.]|uniref:STAS domain-containing protein n=1 Tax=Umezawaea sp. TaxID=1955258 RepID=UPI002ED5C623